MNLTEVFNKMSPLRAIAFGVIAAILYYFLMFDDGRNFMAGIQQNQSRIEELKQKLAEEQKKLERATLFKKTAAEVGTTITKLLGMIPEKFSMPDLMRIISNEAKVAGVSLASISPNRSEQSPIPEFEEMSVSLDMSGSFLQHMVFFSNLTKVNQILIVKKFDMTGSANDDNSSVKMTAEIVAYRYRGTKKAEGQGK